jgi:peptidyl-prolyl cis-trans isomerase C
MRWVFLVFILLSACTFRSTRIGSQPVIQVNNSTLSAKEFADKLARALKHFDSLAAKDPNNVQRAKDEIVRSFIMGSLIFDYAKGNNISVTPDELEKEVDRIRAAYPDDISFRRALADSGTSFSDWRIELGRSLLEKKVFSVIAAKVPAPTASELQKYYEANKEHFKHKDRVMIRQIVVDDISKAQAIREAVKKKDFALIAKKYSVAPEGKAGGLVGWVEKGSVDIFDKAFSLSVGEVSPILESAYGFHIFKVEKKATAGYSSLDEVKKIVEQGLTGQREQAEFSGWLDKQLRSSRVLKDTDLIHSMQIETRGVM